MNVEKKHEIQLKVCLEEDENLTEWEMNFLASLERQFENNFISEKQEQILQKIYDKVV